MSETFVMTDNLATNRSKTYGKVAVLYGGNSAEREVSLRSGRAIYNALLEKGVDAYLVDSRDHLLQQLIDHKIDRAFIALHGRDGEDGVVQGFLQTLKIPYTGSRVAGAAVSMDKLLSKQIFCQQAIKTADFIWLDQKQRFDLDDAASVFAELGAVLFVKPVKEGSSVGMSKVKTPDELIKAIALAHQFDQVALVEKYIQGDEYTVTILAERALPSIRMRTPRDFYDYEAKYHSNTTEYFCPSGLTDVDEAKLQAIAKKAFAVLGCSGWGRVDFIREAGTGQFLILEVNTVPGMTETSLVPKAAKVDGISFAELVLAILDTSFV